MDSQSSIRILVVGGVAGGATAAARARRLNESAEITLLEKGPYVSFANCGLPYYISRDIQKRSSLLMQTPEGFFSRYRVDVKLDCDVFAIDRMNRKVHAKTRNGEEIFHYDRLILAQGGNPLVPSMLGVDLPHVFQLWTIPHMDRIHTFIEEKKPSRAVIAGGGFIGFEMAEALLARGVDVTVVELAPQIMIQMDKEFGAFAKQTLEEKGLHILTGVGLASIAKDSVTLSNGQHLSADMVLLSIGVRPELTLAKASGLEIGASGGLVVNELMQTSDPLIYAAGDMVEVVHKLNGRHVRVPLAGPANRQGRIAATNALGGKMHYHGVLGTSVVKLLDYTAAATGLNEKMATEAGFKVGVAYVTKDNHAGYFPGAEPLFLKLVYDKVSGKVLGGQAFGKAGVDKRIDTIAVALHGKMTLEDLAEIDFAYAPPYSSANDPLNVAAFVGLNNLSGFSPLCSPQETAELLSQPTASRPLVLDVRTFGTRPKKLIQDTLSIPADEVRDRLNEIPQNRPLLILSKDGYLGHIVLRILVGEGYKDVRNIAGGCDCLQWYLTEGVSHEESKIKPNATILDVRTPEEYQEGAYPNAINIPLRELPNRLGELGPKDKPLVVYCLSGARSAAAVRILKGAGFTDVLNAGGLADLLR